MLKGNAVVGQSGGPTAAINATLSGVIRGAMAAKEKGIIDNLYGMINGIEGFLEERFVNLFDAFSESEKLKTLEATPAAALGSCRKRLKSYSDDEQLYIKIVEILKKYNIRYFFYIGGNDSMDTTDKLSSYCESIGYDIKVIGVPKTIDNDLLVTDHTPGFGSAAKYVATTVKELMRDISVYTVKAVTIVEIMGRDAGWLTASSVLPLISGGIAPDLIYLPEVAFDKDEFISSVKAAMEKHPGLLVCVSEGIRYADGEYVGADSSKVDAFGHKMLSGASNVLKDLVKEKLGCKVRAIELNLPQRCAAHCLSKTDIDESVEIGKSAVSAAVDGKSGVMMIFVRETSDGYKIRTDAVPVSEIANGVKKVPREFINKEGNFITEEGIEYLKPLIMGEVSLDYDNGLPRHIVLY